jgi:hypothetical protein
MTFSIAICKAPLTSIILFVNIMILSALSLKINTNVCYSLFFFCKRVQSVKYICFYF